MANLTISIPEELKKKIDLLPELNWSEAIREFLIKKTERAALLKSLDKMLENSELTEEDCIRLGREIKEKVWKRHKKEE